MKNEQEISVRVDAFGNIDTAYYIDQAKQQRGEAFVAVFAKLADGAKRVLGGSRSAPQSTPAYSV